MKKQKLIKKKTFIFKILKEFQFLSLYLIDYWWVIRKIKKVFL